MYVAGNFKYKLNYALNPRTAKVSSEFRVVLLIGNKRLAGNFLFKSRDCVNEVTVCSADFTGVLGLV